METNPPKPNPESATKILLDRLSRLGNTAKGIRILLIIVVMIMAFNLLIDVAQVVGAWLLPQGVITTGAAYEYEVFSTRNQCAPDEETWKIMMTAAALPGYEGEEEIQTKANTAAQKIIQCSNGLLKGYFSERATNGWKLISFEAIPPIEGDFGLEYDYRSVWEK